MKRLLAPLTALFALLHTSCLEAPEGIKPVQGFTLERYLGTWYEIARFDHSFERNLDSVTANYTPREDGGVRVLNRGFNRKTQQWKTAEGRAYFVGAADVGHLKVSFFGPFYGAYVIWGLGSAYDYAFVTSGKDYLWLLARTPTIDDALRLQFLRNASAQGFDTSKLIWVGQSATMAP